MSKANTGRAGLIAVLVIAGAGWGVTQPLAKIAVSEGYKHFGLVFWQLAIGAVALGALNTARGKGLPISAKHLAFYLMIALIGTVLPNSASYQAITHLPSGIVSILLSLVPMLAFPVALTLGLDRFSALRFAGLACGLLGVVLLVAPDASLPEPGMLYWIPVALIAPMFYAVEGNVVAKWGTHGLDPVQVLYGASVIGTIVMLPVAIGTGQWISPLPPYGLPDLAITLSALIHATVYTTYVWLVGRAGPVFAVQISYLVTGFGVIWAMLLLGESYAGPVWAAMAIMFVGLFLVQPRPNVALVPTHATGEDTA
ncbi:MAG: DMT family transporter [Pseudomonadota bacterium]